MLDQVIAVVQALMKEGRASSDTLIYGDSSGGGSAAALVLKMRDMGIGMPAAAVLVSPWCDVTHTGIRGSLSSVLMRISRGSRMECMPRLRTLPPKIRKILMHRPCTGTSAKAFSQHSFRAAPRKYS